MLNVDLLGLVTGERDVEAIQKAFGLQRGELLLIQEIGFTIRIAENQPVIPLCSPHLSFLQEGAKGRNPGPGTHHDDGRIIVLHQLEGLVVMHEDTGLDAIRTISKEG